MLEIFLYDRLFDLDFKNPNVKDWDILKKNLYVFDFTLQDYDRLSKDVVLQKLYDIKNSAPDKYPAELEKLKLERAKYFEDAMAKFLMPQWGQFIKPLFEIKIPIAVPIKEISYIQVD